MGHTGGFCGRQNVVAVFTLFEQINFHRDPSNVVLLLYNGRPERRRNKVFTAQLYRNQIESVFIHIHIYIYNKEEKESLFIKPLFPTQLTVVLIEILTDH